MIRIIRENSTGKTKEMLLEANKFESACIVCKNPDKTREKALAYGISKLEFISYAEAFEAQDSSKNYFIDDLDAFIAALPFKVEGYNLTV